MNKVNLIGRLGKDVEIRYAQNESQTAVGRFSLAVARKYSGADKEKQTDWISCVAFGKTAENISKYFKKGSGIGISGRIQTGSYKDKDGNTKYSFDVVVEDFDFIDKKDSTSAKNATTDNADIPYTTEDADDDDLPF